jgi:hypothetical protein
MNNYEATGRQSNQPVADGSPSLGCCYRGIFSTADPLSRDDCFPGIVLARTSSPVTVEVDFQTT